MVKDEVYDFENIMSQKELISYSMFYAICGAKDSFLITNNKDLIIGQERISSSLWVYIKNNIDEDTIDKAVKIICERLELNPKLNVDGEEKYIKPILERITSISGISFRVSLTKNSYVCHKLIRPQMIIGKFSEAQNDESEVIADFSKANWEDIDFGTLTIEQAQKFAQRRLANPYFHVWRSDTEKIVAMATVHKYGKIAMTDGVFTDRNERKKGYARYLMYTITNNLINDGIVPVLYADSKKEAPNCLYKSLGYEYCGQITEYRTL